ncbi:hypothetical protein GCM10023066_02610 [Nocardioides kongjuensis]
MRVVVEQVEQVGVGRVVANDLEQGQDGELGHGGPPGVVGAGSGGADQQQRQHSPDARRVPRRTGREVVMDP